ncbi:MAG: hypothetical protein IKB80_01125 [Oscillospiraceae bacterium]|nr:hypothetical protein [Oscillospiraceae bacterium]
MKRVLALILTVLLLAGLFPASIVAQADTVTKEGFYLVNWDRNFKTGDYDYVYWMPYTYIDKNKYSADAESIDVSMFFDGHSTSNVEAAAAELHDEFSKRPVGARYINLAALGSVFKKCVKDAIDMEDGVRLVAEWLDRFLAEYKRIGGELDGIAIDLEYNKYSNYYLDTEFYSKNNKNIYNEIVANERVYQNIIRPQLVEWEKQGLFEFYENPDPSQYPDRSEIWTIYRLDEKGGKDFCRSTWNFVLKNYLVGCINRASYEPMIKYFPNAILSDYDTGDAYSWHKNISISGGATGTSVKAGNASNGYYYGAPFSDYYFASSPKSDIRTRYTKPAGYNKAVFNPTNPFIRVLYDVNDQRRLLLSTRDKMGEENANVNVWVPYFHYRSATESYGNSPYFAEFMYHMGLSNPKPFLGYIIQSEVQNEGKEYDDPNMGDYHYALQVSNELLAELSRVAGTSDRKAIALPMSWNEDYILSGMYTGGHNIWRITPDTSLTTVEEFMVSDNVPTFSVSGVTITFPQGRIIKDSKIIQIGSCGYWVETPADVTPVVTVTDDRYAKDPAFGETFSNYKTGAFTGSASSMITSNRADTYWTANGTAAIKKNGDDQVMTLTGTTTLTNTIVPQNITAGDYYAKQQAWEVTVTLPADNYGDIKLLRCGDTDGGIKISGGKVYYDRGGSYQELTGVTVAAGTYTLKREVDFRTEGNYTSSYTVYDSNGSRLGGTEFVAMSAIAIPVANITISTEGATAAVELDDYKLYATGVTTTLELYETVRGRKITETATARTEATAYRLSWMNATNQHRVACIYDVESGAILKKVEMAPGMDGVVTGIVEASESKPVQIAVNVQGDADPNQPDVTPPSETEDAGGEGGNVEGTLQTTPNSTDANTPDHSEKKGLSGGVVALLVVLSLAVLAGGVAAYIFIVKPKLAAKLTEEPEQEGPKQNSEE